jgi:hypothetical protein
MELPLSAVGRDYKDVRRSISILMNLSLVLTFLQAPFLHVHQHEETQRHRGGLLSYSFSAPSQRLGFKIPGIF